MRDRFLDGLRGWAALVVMFGHIVSGVLWPTWEQPIKLSVLDGTFSVYLFFALSGYVLSVGFFSTGRRAIVVDLALRRYLRLTIPIVVISAGAMLLMMAGCMKNIEAGRASGSTHWLSTFFAFEPSVMDMLDFSLRRVYWDPSPITSYNSSLWTMPVEMQGSILVFAFLLLAGKSRFRRAAGHALFLSFTYWHTSPFFAMAIGVVIADFSGSILHNKLRRSAHAKFMVVILLVAAFTAAALRREVQEVRLLSACAGAVIYAVLISAGLQRMLTTPLSLWLGKISFSLYLVHIVVICSFTSWLYLTLGHGQRLEASAAAAVGLVTAVICVAAAALFFPVERLGISSGRKFSAAVLRHWSSMTKSAAERSA